MKLIHEKEPASRAPAVRENRCAPCSDLKLVPYVVKIPQALRALVTSQKVRPYKIFKRPKILLAHQ